MTLSLGLAVAFALIAATPAAADIVFSTHNTIHFDGLKVHHGDVVDYDAAAGSLSLLLDEETLGGKNVDALHLLADGSLIFSAGQKIRLDGVAYEPADLVRYDPLAGTASLWFDGGLFARKADIDAVHVNDDGSFLLSTHDKGELGGLKFDRGDIVQFNPATGAASILLDGSAFGGNGNVDAIHKLNDDELLISTHANSTLYGMAFGGGDVICVNLAMQAVSMYLPESTFGNGAANIDALAFSPSIPEPATLALLALGALACRRRRV